MTAHHEENFAQLIQWIMDERGVSMSEIARRIGVRPATVSAWRGGKRGSKRGPQEAEVLRRLARAYNIDEDRVFAAVSRRTPGPLSKTREQQILELFRELTEAQQIEEIVALKARAEYNRTRPSGV